MIKGKTGRKKGQLFFIAGIFVIIGFIFLRNLLALPVISEEKIFQETLYVDRNTVNLQNEYANIAGTATMQPQANKSGAEYLYNFSSYVSGDLDSRILYALVIANGSTQNFSVTIGNFLKRNITGTVNFTSSTPAYQTFSLKHGSNATFHFNATSAFIRATLDYGSVENFYFNVSTKNYAAAFFDIELHGGGMMIRTKSYYNRTW